MNNVVKIESQFFGLRCESDGKRFDVEMGKCHLVFSSQCLPSSCCCCCKLSDPHQLINIKLWKAPWLVLFTVVFIAFNIYFPSLTSTQLPCAFPICCPFLFSIVSSLFTLIHFMSLQWRWILWMGSRKKKYIFDSLCNSCTFNYVECIECIQVKVIKFIRLWFIHESIMARMEISGRKKTLDRSIKTYGIAVRCEEEEGGSEWWWCRYLMGNWFEKCDGRKPLYPPHLFFIIFPWSPNRGVGDVPVAFLHTHTHFHGSMDVNERLRHTSGRKKIIKVLACVCTSVKRIEYMLHGRLKLVLRRLGYWVWECDIVFPLAFVP